jgi:integrase/recombinase XerD
MFAHHYTEPEFADAHFRKTIPPKSGVSYVLLAAGRAVGYYRTLKGPGRWTARVRVTTGCLYREKSMGLADDGLPADGVRVLTYEQAKQRASEWFNTPELRPIRVEERPLGVPIQLNVCPVGEDYTVAHAMRDYCQRKKEFCAVQSHQAAVSRANVYTLPLLGNTLCAELTAQQCRSLLLFVEGSVVQKKVRTRLTQIDARTLDPEVRRRRRITANNTFTDLRSALNMAFGDGKIATNAAWRYVKIFGRVERARTDILTWEQAKRLVDMATPEFRRLILAALYTGCRLTELFQMKVGDIEPTRAAIYVRPIKSYRGRTLALPGEGYQFFKTLAEGRSKDSPLIRRNHDWPWTTSYVAEHFKKMAKKIGLPDSFVFHCLRHTYASLLLRSNTPPIVVARQLGHKNMETTLRTYAHVTDDFMDHEFRARFKPGFLTSPDLFAGERS